MLTRDTDWGMGKGFNEWFLQTGFCGAIFVVNVAQLATQITASIFPVGLINNKFMNLMLAAMLFTEFSGLADGAALTEKNAALRRENERVQRENERLRRAPDHAGHDQHHHVQNPAFGGAQQPTPAPQNAAKSRRATAPAKEEYAGFADA